MICIENTTLLWECHSFAMATLTLDVGLDNTLVFDAKIIDLFCMQIYRKPFEVWAFHLINIISPKTCFRRADEITFFSPANSQEIVP
jgi:hypothetical protein